MQKRNKVIDDVEYDIEAMQDVIEELSLDVSTLRHELDELRDTVDSIRPRRRLKMRKVKKHAKKIR
jgi:cell division septum initiation protein DivIVA